MIIDRATWRRRWRSSSRACSSAAAADDIYEVMFGDDAPHGMLALLVGADGAAK